MQCQWVPGTKANDINLELIINFFHCTLLLSNYFSVSLYSLGAEGGALCGRTMVLQNSKIVDRGSKELRIVLP